MIYVNAPISAGKTSLVKILTRDIDGVGFYEKVESVPMLKKFYSAGEESRLSLAFPLQIAFLNYRYQQLREGLALAEQGNRCTVYDSSLLSDSLMAGNLYRRGEFPEEEYYLYQELSQNMQANVSGHPFTGFPDLIIYLKMSFDTMLEHITHRGREMEALDDDKIDYYRGVWETYNHWYNSYSSSRIITIDMDKTDFVHNEDDRNRVLNLIESVMVDAGLITREDAIKFRNNRDHAKLIAGLS